MKTFIFSYGELIFANLTDFYYDNAPVRLRPEEYCNIYKECHLSLTRGEAWGGVVGELAKCYGIGHFVVAGLPSSGRVGRGGDWLEVGGRHS